MLDIIFITICVVLYIVIILVVGVLFVGLGILSLGDHIKNGIRKLYTRTKKLEQKIFRG